MRIVKNPQLQFGQVDISKIQFDPKCRDDIPQILKGLQYLYINRAIREEIFGILEKNITPKIDKKNGRPGMELWKILVLGVLRLDLNCDYDRIHNLANSHKEIRQMIGHSDWFDTTKYHLQTVKDNVSLLTPDLLDQINQVVVRSGHVLLKKKETQVLRGRCDSFVVETNVHYPTDINLLFDAMRKIIVLIARLSEQYGHSDWRQNVYNIRHLKRLMRTAQSKKRSNAKTEEQKKKREALIKEAHSEYINVAKRYLNKTSVTLEVLKNQGLQNFVDNILMDSIEKEWMMHAKRQIEQIERRVLQGETIASHEKIFSIFEPHTEWVSKGKAGVPVELGVRVCVMEDQYQFILHHQVMEKKTDDQVCVSMVVESQQRFPDLKVSSFDKGFHSPENQQALSEKLDLVALPRKGRLSEQARAIEGSEEFRKARRKHSAVESAINALEVHGLDRCPDHGMDGFKRYIALSIVARNIQRIGALLQQREQEKWARWRKKHYSSDHLKLAA